MIRGLLGLAKYAQGLFSTTAKSGKLPVLNTALKAWKNPVMSREKFLKFSAGGIKEATAQSKYLEAINAINKNKEIGKVLLNANKSLVDKVAILTSKINTGVLISKAAGISKQMKLLKKNPAKFKLAKQRFINEQANEWYFSEPSMPIAKMIKVVTADVNKMPKNELLKELAENSFVTKGIKSALKSKHMRKLNLTKDDILKVSRLKEQAKKGHVGYNDPILNKFFDTREAYRKITGMSHYQVQSMASGGKGYYATPGYKGLDVSKKTIKEVKEAASPLKEAWKALKKDFLDEYHK